MSDLINFVVCTLLKEEVRNPTYIIDMHDSLDYVCWDKDNAVLLEDVTLTTEDNGYFSISGNQPTIHYLFTHNGYKYEDKDIIDYTNSYKNYKNYEELFVKKEIVTKGWSWKFWKGKVVKEKRHVMAIKCDNSCFCKKLKPLTITTKNIIFKDYQEL